MVGEHESGTGQPELQGELSLGNQPASITADVRSYQREKMGDTGKRKVRKLAFLLLSQYI